MEIWKEIKGYEGIYEVSDLGKIRTCEGKTTNSVRHGIRVWKQRIMKYKGYTPNTGYRVTLWKDKKPKDFLVSRLVAFTFYDKDISERWLTVNHIDGDRMNNVLSNLELVSLGDNIRHGFETGLYTSQKETKILFKSTNEVITFRSISLAERYLGLNHGRIYDFKKKNKLDRGEYIILNDNA